LEPRGQLVIIRPAATGPPVLAQLFLFTCRSWTGSPVEYVHCPPYQVDAGLTPRSDEMRPEWFAIDGLPFERMVGFTSWFTLTTQWPEAPLYLPHLLKRDKNTRITGKFQYTAGSRTALDGWWLGSLSTRGAWFD
jgi:hypothetical protein